MIALLLSGCTSTSGGAALGEPAAQVTASDFKFEDKWCSDDVPFTFTIHNVGQVEARQVNVFVQPSGYAGYSTNAGTVPMGASSVVSGTFQAHDNCGSTDSIPVIIHVQPANGPEFQLTTAVSI